MSGVADAKPDTPRNGKCVAANVVLLKGAIGGVANSAPGALAGVIQTHLDGNGLALSTSPVPCPNVIPMSSTV